MPWLFMASEEFPFTDIKYWKTSRQSIVTTSVIFLSFFTDLSIEKPAHIKGLIFSALCFPSVYSDRCEKPVKITTVSQQSPSSVFAVHKRYATWQMSVQRKSCCAHCFSETRIKYAIQQGSSSIPTHHFISHFFQTENLCSGFGSLTQDHVSEITDFNGNIKVDTQNNIWKQIWNI